MNNNFKKKHTSIILHTTNVRLDSWPFALVVLHFGYFWVDDFPNFPFGIGYVCIRSLEGNLLERWEWDYEIRWLQAFSWYQHVSTILWAKHTQNPRVFVKSKRVFLLADLMERPWIMSWRCGGLERVVHGSGGDG